MFQVETVDPLQLRVEFHEEFDLEFVDLRIYLLHRNRERLRLRRHAERRIKEMRAVDLP